MISHALQEEITAAVCPDAVVQAHTKMGVVGIEPTRREQWRVWVYAPGEPRLRLFLVMLRGNAGHCWTFDVQYGFDVAAIHALREWRSLPLEREVCRLVCDYGRWIEMPPFRIGEVSVPIHPLFDTTDRLWSIQAAFEDRGQDLPAELLPTLAWLHDGAIYLTCGSATPQVKPGSLCCSAIARSVQAPMLTSSLVFLEYEEPFTRSAQVQTLE
jgi:hypothetical protein